MSTLFPIFVKLTRRTVLVVGAGQVAERKISQLLSTGCHIRVVSPAATEQIRAWSHADEVEWKQKTFEPSDLDGILLAVVCTSSPELNTWIYQIASERRVLCNVVDVPDLCDFYYPAIVRRGDLQIAISTSGQSPALAQRIRRDLETRFQPEYEDFVSTLGGIRRWILRQGFSPEWRKRLLHACASRPAEAVLRVVGRRPWEQRHELG